MFGERSSCVHWLFFSLDSFMQILRTVCVWQLEDGPLPVTSGVITLLVRGSNPIYSSQMLRVWNIPPICTIKNQSNVGKYTLDLPPTQ